VKVSRSATPVIEEAKTEKKEITLADNGIGPILQ